MVRGFDLLRVRIIFRDSFSRPEIQTDGLFTLLSPKEFGVNLMGTNTVNPQCWILFFANRFRFKHKGIDELGLKFDNQMKCMNSYPSSEPRSSFQVDNEKSPEQIREAMVCGLESWCRDRAGRVYRSYTYVCSAFCVPERSILLQRGCCCYHGTNVLA